MFLKQYIYQPAPVTSLTRSKPLLQCPAYATSILNTQTLNSYLSNVQPTLTSTSNPYSLLLTIRFLLLVVC